MFITLGSMEHLTSFCGSQEGAIFDASLIVFHIGGFPAQKKPKKNKKNLAQESEK